ncbi:hypothetical protein F8X59_08355 [Salmonella enterica]|nr:hypothetical protein [Salmonella enterica]
MATPCRRPVNGPCAVPADSRHFRPERVKADLSDLEASRSASVNATMFDRYLPFSCPLKYFRY